jgi:hypothetical protein
MTSSDVPDDQAGERPASDPEGMSGADTGAGAGTWGAPGPATWAARAAAPAWAALAARQIREEPATSEAAASPGRRRAT